MGCRSVLERTPSRTALHRARARLAWELTRTDGPAESFAWRTWTARETVTAHEPHTFGSQGATVARRAQGRGERGKESEAHWQSFDILWFTSSSTMYTMFIRVRVPQPTRPQTSRYPWMEVPEMHAHVRECVVIRNDNRATHTHTHTQDLPCKRCGSFGPCEKLTPRPPSRPAAHGPSTGTGTASSHGATHWWLTSGARCARWHHIHGRLSSALRPPRTSSSPRASGGRTKEDFYPVFTSILVLPFGSLCVHVYDAMM